MDLEQRIRTKAYRKLRRFANYQQIMGDPHRMPTYAQDITLSANEKPVGIYENIPGEPDKSILITTSGLYIDRDENWIFIGYDQIERIEVPPEKSKSLVAELIIYLASGEAIELPVQGGKDKFRDIWGFLHFLRQIVTSVPQYKG